MKVRTCDFGLLSRRSSHIAFISPFAHPLASVTLKKSRVICPDTKSTMHALHIILYTLGHNIGLFYDSLKSAAPKPFYHYNLSLELCFCWLHK